MPHLHLDDFTPPLLPFSVDGCTFSYLAKNSEKDDEYLIETHVQESHFFLLYQFHNQRHLLKSDKTSRPAKLHHIKQALMAFATGAHLPIKQSNIDTTKASSHMVDDSALKQISTFTQPLDKELVIEVGFGSGRHLIEQAKKNPHLLHIGLEIYKPSIMQVLKQINIQHISNLWLLDYDARLFLELIASNSVRTIYVHFPVPWDKKPHRRVYSQPFIDEALRTLHVGGTLELRTDSMNYYRYVSQLFQSQKALQLRIQKDSETVIRSKYEERWRKQEKHIFDIIATNEYESEPLIMPEPFTFLSRPLKSLDFLRTLQGFTHRGAQMFIHIERLYTLQDNALLLRLSMGDFNRPEHLYLKIFPNQISYFPQEPLPSRANATMHQKLCEVLYG